MDSLLNEEGALGTKSGVVILREEIDTQCTLCSSLTYTFLTFFSRFLSTEICFSPFHFFFLMKYQTFATECWPLKKQNRWSEIVCGTVRVIVVWLTSSEWVYLFVSCLKLILVSRFKSNWWAQQGIGTWPNYKAPGNLLVELMILLW